MTRRIFSAVVVAVLVNLTVSPVSAAPSVVDLSNPPPAAAPAETTAMRKALADLTIELDQLRADVRELRGQMEVQSHEVEMLKSRNRESVSDTDKRLRELEKRGTPAAAVETPSVAVGEQKEYDAAFALMKQGNYDRAAKAFREFIVRHPQSDLAGNAQYWVGESLYVTRNFKQAATEYGKVVDLYPSNAKVADALLKVGYSQQELGANDKAREALQKVVSQYPNTTASKLAESRLAELKPVETKPKPKTSPAKPDSGGNKR